MDVASSKAAEDLFHRTLAKMWTDPLENMSPEMKKKMTPSSLACMGFVGISYFISVGVVIYLGSMAYTIPVASDYDMNLTFTRRIIASFMMLNIVINFVLIRAKQSFYVGNLEINVKAGCKERCLDCQHAFPPDVHHCSLCQRCIVKRDHHCFFTGCCVGFSNQRYFLVYCFYNGIGCMYVMYFAWRYIIIIHGHPADYGYYPMILPLAIVQWLLGYSSLDYLGAVALFWLCMITAVGSTFLFLWQFFLAVYGTTSYQFWKEGGIKGIRPLQIPIRRNLRSVFGPWWCLNFVLPMPFLEQPNDGSGLSSCKQV